jgi:hypothetical protein
MKPLLCAAALCLFPSLSMAQGSGETIGTYFDPGATQTSLAVAPLEVFTIYFIAENVPTGIGGYEFLVDMPPELLILSVTTHPVAFNTLDIDSSNEGFIVGIGGPCLTGPKIVLAEFTCMAMLAGSGLEITLGPVAPSSFGGLSAGYAECGSLALYPFADAYPGPAIVDVLGTADCQWYCGSGTNLDNYTVIAPIALGQTFEGSVIVSPPNVGAVIAGYLGKLTFPIWGQEGLVDPTQNEVLGFPLGFVPSPVTITWSVPNEPAYAALHVYTQAASFGGGVINLTCAYDCTVGF